MKLKARSFILWSVSCLSLAYPIHAGETGVTPESVYEIANRVADWQIATFETQGEYRALPLNPHPWQTREKHHELDWTSGALYAGMYQWSQIATSRGYADWLRQVGERNAWKLHERPYHADDHTVGQFYLSLFRDTQDPRMLEPTRKHFDWILQNRRTGTLEWTANPTDAHHRWGWCDALFMAPPVWARLARITGDHKYLAFMDEEYRATYDLLWDEQEHLFWRDSSFFDHREKNGSKVFWSRGNGWVFGGLALMIPDFPEQWERRSFYIDTFRQMAEVLKRVQRSDGTWSMGLLGAEKDYEARETSGTAFYTFGLAWGIRTGILDRDEYMPVVMKAWKALVSCVDEKGMLRWVQPIGAAPGESFENYSELYGVGAFLAASSEVYRLMGGRLPVVDPARKMGVDSGEVLTVMKDGGWCWYQDPRALIADGKLIVGGVSGKSGDVKVAVYDLKADKDLGTVVLHPDFQADDHDAPAFYRRKDGSILAMWAKHCDEKNHHYTWSVGTDFTQWHPRKEYQHSYDDPRGVTYMNLYRMEAEDRLYNFFRDGLHFNPCYVVSEDDGETWGGFQHLIAHEIGGRHRPYTRYFQRDADTVGISFTDGHPRQFGNSLYYVDFRDGAFYRVDGSKIRDVSDGPLRPSEVEKVFKGSDTQIKPKGYESVPFSAWNCASAVDAAGNPHVGYSLYLSNDDHRYRIASWDGNRWVDREIAYAGHCLYTAESSYTGLFAFDPGDPTRVFISTDVDPCTGKELGGRHELFTAVIGPKDDIGSIRWSPLTGGSSWDNIRPMVVAGDGYKVLVWLNGPWSTYVDYEVDVRAIVLEHP